MSRSLDRRAFVGRLAALPVGACAATLPLAACAGVPYVVGEPTDGVLAVPASVLAEGGGVFVEVPGSERPLYLHRPRGAEPVALLARCTHRGCQPEPVAERLVCPCHGSEFDLEGRVLEGPADRPLARYRVSESGDRLLIHLTGATG